MGYICLVLHIIVVGVCVGGKRWGIKSGGAEGEIIHRCAAKGIERGMYLSSFCHFVIII